MRFVATKTPEQQSCLTLHRTHHLLMRQQTAVINAIRSRRSGEMHTENRSMSASLQMRPNC